jgi:hypothetical protein
MQSLKWRAKIRHVAQRKAQLCRQTRPSRNTSFSAAISSRPPTQRPLPESGSKETLSENKRKSTQGTTLNHLVPPPQRCGRPGYASRPLGILWRHHRTGSARDGRSILDQPPPEAASRSRRSPHCLSNAPRQPHRAPDRHRSYWSRYQYARTHSPARSATISCWCLETSS